MNDCIMKSINKKHNLSLSRTKLMYQVVSDVLIWYCLGFFYKEQEDVINF